MNGAPAEPAEERPWFGDLTAVFPSEKLPGPDGLKEARFGRGSRVAIAGPPGSGATSLLREIAVGLAEDAELGVQVVLAGVRPEEVAEWRHRGPRRRRRQLRPLARAQAQAAELAVERAKRRVERGGHAVVLIDSLEALPAARAAAVRRRPRDSRRAAHSR